MKTKICIKGTLIKLVQKLRFTHQSHSRFIFYGVFVSWMQKLIRGLARISIPRNLIPGTLFQGIFLKMVWLKIKTMLTAIVTTGNKTFQSFFLRNSMPMDVGI
jgi:hypothetical protein